jgi:hypothetical protein
VASAIGIKAQVLENSVWSVVKVECTATAEDSVQQLFLDSIFGVFRQKTVDPADQYVYEFTQDELLKKKKKKEVRWKYKETDGNLIVDMGKGIILIQKYEIKQDTLVLEMDKPLFFLSEFGSKVKDVKSMVKDVSLRYYYKKYVCPK